MKNRTKKILCQSIATVLFIVAMFCNVPSHTFWVCLGVAFTILSWNIKDKD